jgi:hypothetical protein
MESKVVVPQRRLISFTHRALRRLRFFPFTLLYAAVNATVRVVHLRQGRTVVHVGEVTGDTVSLPSRVMLWLDRVATGGTEPRFDICLKLPRETTDDNVHDVCSVLLTSPRLRSVGLYWDASSLADDLSLWQAKRGRNDPTVVATSRESLDSLSFRQLQEFCLTDHAGIALPIAATRDAQTLLKRQAGDGLAVCLNLPPEAWSVAGLMATEFPMLRFFELSPAGTHAPGPLHNLVALHSWGLNLHERMALVSGADAYVGPLDVLGAAAVMAGRPAVLIADAPEASGLRQARGGGVWCVSTDSAALAGSVRELLESLPARSWTSES